MDASSGFNYDPEKNYDEEIMAQQKEIEKEISDTQPLISDKYAVMDLVDDYAKEDQVYKHKLTDLGSRFKNIRKTRGDGNCFFRAFGFSYLESLLSSPDDFKRFKEIVLKSKDELIKLGFPSFTLEDFHDTFMEIVGQVENPGTVDKLLETFNDQGLSDYFVVYLRLLVSGFLQKEQETYVNFIDGGRTVKQFCSQEVEPMGHESDHIHIVALSKALEVTILVEYMDRGGGNTCNSHTFTGTDAQEQSNSQPSIHLLYKPGHYDILYL